LVRRWPQKGRRWKANIGKIVDEKVWLAVIQGNFSWARHEGGLDELSREGPCAEPTSNCVVSSNRLSFGRGRTVNAPTELFPVILQMDGLGAPGTTGAYPPFGRPDLVFGGGGSTMQNEEGGGHSAALISASRRESPPAGRRGRGPGCPGRASEGNRSLLDSR
jgi:hypothetical protein